MTKYMMELSDAKKIYNVFFKRLSQNKLIKMKEHINGTPVRKYLFPKKSHRRSPYKFDMRISYCHGSRRIWSNGVNYTRRINGLRKLKICLFFCFANCGLKFLGYFNGVNQRQYCKKCSHLMSLVNDE